MDGYDSPMSEDKFLKTTSTPSPVEVILETPHTPKPEKTSLTSGTLTPEETLGTPDTPSPMALTKENAGVKQETVSKRKQIRIDRDAKRKKITLVPIPTDFDCQKKAFIVNDQYKIDAEHMQELWSVEQGKAKDGFLVKRAAEMLIGSPNLVAVGCVAGITKNVVRRTGLDPVALEAIRAVSCVKCLPTID